MLSLALFPLCAALQTWDRLCLLLVLLCSCEVHDDRGVCGDFFLECEIQGLAPMLGSFAGCFLDRLGEEVRFATAAVAWLSSITKETFLEDMTALEFFDEFIDLFDAAPTDVAAGEWGSLSLSSSKPKRLRIRRDLKPSPRC